MALYRPRLIRWPQPSACITAIVLLLLAGCARAPSTPLPYKETRELMGTYITVTVYPSPGLPGRDAADRAFGAIEEVDRLMSDYKADSELSAINQAAGLHPVAVSAATYECVERALRIAELSGGAFDPTVRPLVQLWKQAGREGKLPDPQVLEHTRALVNWRRVALTPPAGAAPPQVLLTEPGMELDLGGIAKGYASDRAARTLKALGVSRALIASAGDIYAIGTHPDGRAWRVDIQDPTDANRTLPDGLLLSDRAVSTSGDYRRFVEIGGRRYSHIVDPHSGMPVEHMASVTVVAPAATDADALATALSVLGPERGMKLLSSFSESEALVMVRLPSGEIREERSPGFDAYLER